MLGKQCDIKCVGQGSRAMNILWVAGVRVILKKGGAVLHSQVLDQSGSINTGVFGTKLRITIDQLDGAIGLGVCGYKSEAFLHEATVLL